MRNIPLIIIFILFSSFLRSQDVNERGTESKEVIECLTKIADEEEHKNLEILIRSGLTNNLAKTEDDVIEIRTVVHVIHDGDSYGMGSNISDEQIYSAINGMNEDYRKMYGTDGYGDGTDTQIQFHLATCDPEGNPTTGINRINGAFLSTTYENEGISAGQGQGENEVTVKNWSRWPNQEYYNIWIVSEIENNNGGSGIQGYAYFPTVSLVDGTVNLYNAFGIRGPYNSETGVNFNLKSYTNRNRTITHELGHAGALFHTFQGNSCIETNCNFQGDRVCDTDPHTVTSSCNSFICGGNYNKDNYMGYTSESCKDAFTEGQKDRMRSALTFNRSNLISQPLCLGDATDIDFDIIWPVYSSCSDDPENSVFVKLTNTGEGLLQRTRFVGNLGDQVIDYEWAGCLGPNQSDSIFIGNGIFNEIINTVILNVTEVNRNVITPIEKSKEVIVSGNQFGYIEVMLDALGGQNSWEITNTESGEIVLASEGYLNFNQGSIYLSDVCLLDGCYEFNVYNVVGNGICCQNGIGYIKFFDQEDNLLVEFTDFGSIGSYGFCVDFTEDPDPEFDLISFDGKCSRISESTSQIYLEFTVENEGNIDGYQIDHYNAEDMSFVGSYNIESQGCSDPCTYPYIINNFPPVSYFKIYKIENGQLNGIGELKIECKTKYDPCGFTIVKGFIIPNNPAFQVYIVDMAFYNETVGGDISGLQPGFYLIILVGPEGNKECVVPLGITK